MFTVDLHLKPPDRGLIDDFAPEWVPMLYDNALFNSGDFGNYGNFGNSLCVPLT
jgi:hypothetical protein